MAKKKQPTTAASPRTKGSVRAAQSPTKTSLPIQARLSAGAGHIILPANGEARVAVLGDPHFHHATPESRLDDYGQTCIQKFRDVVDKALELKCHALIILGDLFNRPSQPMSYYTRVQREFIRAWVLGLPVFTIPGNHDLPFHKMSKLDDTALGALTGSGWCPILKTVRFEVKCKDGVKAVDLVGAGIDVEPTERRPDVWRSIYFDHRFWGSGADEYVLTKEDAAVLGHDVYCLGHDHIAYPEQFMEQNGHEFIVVRPGSMTRATSHFHQVVRQVQFAVIQYGDQNALWYEDIACLPPDQVYRADALGKRKPVKKIDVERFVDSIERHKVDGKSAYTFLKEVEGEEPVKKYVRGLLQEYGVKA